jgi:SAM-dependent methyltransferase
MVLNTQMTKNELWYTDREIPYSLLTRAKKTAAFVDEIKEPILDIGEDNPFKQLLEIYLELRIESTVGEIDFDYDKLQVTKKFNTIFCFEVLEHLFNPLFFLERLKDILTDDGIIYLSTPRNGCTKLRWYYRHYNEIPDKQIKWLFDRAKLKIVKTDRISFHEHWWQIWHGIRPVLKYFNKTRLYKLQIDE